jgi:hypothetical protein
MSQHTHVTTEGEIFAVGDNRDEYVGCIGTCPGEPAEVTEARWNRFAQTMWDYGVEPTEDEPVYSITEDEVVYDHYLLRMIHPIQNHIGKIAGALVAASAVATTFADRTAMLAGTFLNHAA